MEDINYIYATAGLMVLYFLHQVVSRKFDPFAPVWLFLVGYLQVYVIQAFNFHDWAVEVRGKDLVTAANFRSFWALLWFLLVYQFGPARIVRPDPAAPPMSWSTALAHCDLPSAHCLGALLRKYACRGRRLPISRAFPVRKHSSDHSHS